MPSAFLKLAQTNKLNSICHTDFPQRSLRKNITNPLALGIYFLNEPNQMNE